MGGPSTPVARFGKDGNIFDRNVTRTRTSQNVQSKLASRLLNKTTGSSTTDLHKKLQRSDSSPNMTRFNTRQRAQVRIQERKSDESWTSSGQSSSMPPADGRHTKREHYFDHNSDQKSKHRSKKHKHKDHKKKKRKKHARSSQHKSTENDLKNSPGTRSRSKTQTAGDRERSSSAGELLSNDLRTANNVSSRSFDDLKSPKFDSRLSRSLNHHRGTNSGSVFSRSLNDLDRSTLSVTVNREGTSLVNSMRTPPLSPAPPSRVDAKSKVSSQSPRNSKPRDKLPVLNARDLAKSPG